MKTSASSQMKFYDNESFQKVMQRVNLRYAKWFRSAYRYCGHVFQDRFKSFAINDDRYLLECGRYIERNPLEAMMVKDLGDYRWSSYRFYVEAEKEDLLTANPLFQELGETEEVRRSKYREFLTIERPHEELIRQGIWGLKRKVSL